MTSGTTHTGHERRAIVHPTSIIDIVLSLFLLLLYLALASLPLHPGGGTWDLGTLSIWLLHSLKHARKVVPRA